MRLRLSGVLLHISSLPSAHGIGDFGPSAHDFARLLAASGQSLWQFLPLNPTSPAIGNSPYSSPSAFAGNTSFISPELLIEEGFVSREDVERAAFGEVNWLDGGTDVGYVDFERVEGSRRALLQTAFDRNRHRLDADSSFQAFTEANAYWLDDYVRFVTIKNAHGGAAWINWPESLARRDMAALNDWDMRENIAMQREKFAQYLFYRQWAGLRRVCSCLGVRLVGDVPIYVTHDSADVWANPHLFKLDGAGFPFVVAGVPPDYFSPTGQRWGNPLYNWEALGSAGYDWWVRRIMHNLAMFDCLRLDHFRGFAGYWEIPAIEKTAINGRWVDAPGRQLFHVLVRRLLSLPFIAEDLGVITPDVRELQHEMGFPGMAVLQFGFGGNLAENPHAPFMQRPNQVVYTGTHDNAPAKGWFQDGASHQERENLAAYTGWSQTPEMCAGALIRLALGSVADTCIIPAQDILGLGMEARMNTPSTVTGNWAWRLRPNQLTHQALEWFESATALFGRHAGRR